MGGILDIAIQKEPGAEWRPEAGDRHTNLGIEAVEWQSLFFKSLGVPEWETYVEGEDIDEYYERQKVLFQSSVTNKGFPMLSRIWRIYKDAEYSPEDVNVLFEECSRLLGSLNDRDAKSAIEKLMSACRDAKKTNSGIALLSD